MPQDPRPCQALSRRRLAHDINNLLGVIKGNCALLRDRVEEEGLAELEDICAATEALRRLGQELAACPGPATVLVVEGDDAVRRLTVRALEREGYRVLSAANGTHALELLHRAEEVDLLLCEVRLAGAPGPQVAGAFLGRDASIRVLYMSGWVGEEISSAGVLHEGVELVMKPFTPRGLAARVEAVLG